jgi:hypothetical protein
MQKRKNRKTGTLADASMSSDIRRKNKCLTPECRQNGNCHISIAFALCVGEEDNGTIGGGVTPT